MRALLVICVLAVPAFAQPNPDADADKPYEHFVKQCKAKVISACTEQAQRLVDGTGVAKDEKAGFALWTQSCKARDGRACNNLGTSWSDGNQGATAVDHVKAKAHYEKACTLKNGFGCFNLGNVFRLGEGVQPDPKKAGGFFAKSCDLGNPKGCTELGIIYYEGKVFPKNEKKAIELFEKACKLGSEVACKNHKALTKT